MQLCPRGVVRSSLAVLLLSALTLAEPAAIPFARAVLPAAGVAQAASGKLEIQNLDKVPYDDRLVFQRSHGKGDPSHNEVRLRIRNGGTGPLTVSSLAVSGGDAASFTIAAADAAGFTLEPSQARDVLVRFVAGTNGTKRGPRLSSLVIQSNDPNQPTKTVELSGYNMVGVQGDNEMTLQEVVDTFGYRVNILNPGEAQSLRGGVVNGVYKEGAYIAVGDEVLSPLWTRADSARPVYVRQLATFSGSGTATIRVTGPGGGAVAYGTGQIQTLLPTTTGGLPTEMTLNPTSPGFEVTVKQYSSKMGAAGEMHSVRFWPVRDRSGALVPNSYIVGADNTGFSSTNYDYQDFIYLITNIRPQSQAADPSQPAAKPGSAGLVREFDQAYAGTLGDKDNAGTGFSETQRNKADIHLPQQGPSGSYDKARLDLVTTGQGTLTLRAAAGSNEAAVNTLVNGMCLPFDARSGRFVVSTRLVGPLNSLSAAQQQAGLMFGPNQGNFIKLTAGTQITGTASGNPWIQLSQELNNVATQVGQRISIPSPESVATLDLQLTGDPSTGEVEAAYRVNNDAFITLPDRVVLTGTARARFFDLRTKGCILASSRGSAEFNATFDRFAIEVAPPPAGLPTVDAGPDQAVRSGATVTLNGTATDASGGALIGSWQQVGGSPSVTLSGSGNTRSFTAPSGYSVLTFAFAAANAQNRSASDTVTITVGDEPIKDLVITSNAPVAVNTIAQLAASTSGGAQPISYLWDFGDGSAPVTGGAIINHTYKALGSYKATVTATNAAGSVSATTTVVVQTAVPDFAFRYDAGSTADVTTGGVTWKKDAGLFTPTNSPAEKRGTGVPPIANTTDDIIYQTYRGKDTSAAKTLTYDVPIHAQLNLPPGTLVRLNLRLHFAEIYWGGTTPGSGPGGIGKRVFDVSVEGQQVLDEFDITREAGKAETAIVVPINNVEVSDGKLTLSLKASVDFAAISGFEILRAADPPVENIAPTAAAGADQAVQVGNQVTLSGTGTDPEGQPLTFSWAQDQTGAPPVALAGEGAVRTFAPTTPGVYRFTLTATDSGGLSSSDSVTITVSDGTTPPPPPPNQAPAADAGVDQVVPLGSSVVLAGSATDPDGDNLTVTWSQSPNGSPTVNLQGSGTSRTFTPAVVGAYIFTFTVTDSGGLTASDTVVVNIVAPGTGNNQVPVANAGNNQSVQVGRAVTLTGSGSDPENGKLTYTWLQVAGPAVTLSGEGPVRTFTPAGPGTYSFTLVVTDEAGLSGADTMVITVLSAGGAGDKRVLIPIMLR